MKYLVVSYSFSGNNARLAKGLAEKINSDHIKIEEARKRRIPTILFDIIFNRTPKIRPIENELSDYDYVVFVAPIWFGKIATPFRQLFKACKDYIHNYAFVSLSGGTNGIAPNVRKELETYLGKAPQLLEHHLICDLVPYEQRGDRKILHSYKLNDSDATMLINNTALEIIKSNK